MVKELLEDPYAETGYSVEDLHSTQQKTNWSQLIISSGLIQTYFKTVLMTSLIYSSCCLRMLVMAWIGGTLCSAPPSALAEIFRHTCLQSGPQTSTPFAKNAYPKFQNPKTTFQMFTWQQFSNLTGQCTNLAPTNSSQMQRTHSALTNLFYPDYYSIIY